MRAQDHRLPRPGAASVLGRRDLGARQKRATGVCDNGTCVDKCTENALQCSNGDLQHCVNGVYTLLQNCEADCVNDKCTECTPPAEECTNSTHLDLRRRRHPGHSVRLRQNVRGQRLRRVHAQRAADRLHRQHAAVLRRDQQLEGVVRHLSGVPTRSASPASVVALPGGLGQCTGRLSTPAGSWLPDPVESRLRLFGHGAGLFGRCRRCVRAERYRLFGRQPPRSYQPNGARKTALIALATRRRRVLGGGCVQCTPNATPTHCASACTKAGNSGQRAGRLDGLRDELHRLRQLH